MSGKVRPIHAPELVADLMSESQGGFGRILRRARQLERLNRQIQTLLEPHLACSCRLINIRQDTMVFGCTSAACATQLRMLAPDLVRRLHQAGLDEIEKIEVRMMAGA